MKTLMTRDRQREMISEMDQHHNTILGGLSRVHESNNVTFTMPHHNSSLSHHKHHEEMSVLSSRLCIAFGSILILLAIILNLHDLYKLWFTRRKWSSTHVFLFALAISDLLVAFLAFPGFIVYTSSQETWPLGVNLCLLWLYVDWITTITTSTFVMIIFVNHIIIFYVPEVTHKIPGASASAVGLFLYANMLLLPVYVSDSMGIVGKDSSESICFIRTYEHSKWQIAYFVCGCYLPAIVVVVSCLVIRGRLSRSRSRVAAPAGTVLSVISLNNDAEVGKPEQSRQMSSDSASSSIPMKKERDLLQHSSVIALGVVFLFCWTPGYIYDLLDAYANFESHAWDMMSFWLIYLCAFLNPIAIHLPKTAKTIGKLWSKT
ncbi:hypothetical protein BV898_13625 [Hypsibius exemplaris]|uniref:G-protein coupled receptors family 1 profile domain-containing protein n=1 Tax=Hypsibius exemplaris TaxID=2072580 RepID=A0A1W0WA23_HYPEX|nr:hypothetical protein BV898_13625 [Hypsibius exemplaris]